MGLGPDTAISHPSMSVLPEGTAAVHRFALHPKNDVIPLGSFAKKGRGGSGRMGEEQTGGNR